MNDKELFNNICNLTTSVLGLRKGSLAFKSRVRSLQFARMIASVIARKEEGIKHKIIAEKLNRHRTLIYHYEDSHEGNFMFPEYREAYIKVYMAFYKLDNKKKVFTDMRVMKDFLIKKGVKEHPKSEISIIVKSGNVGCGIKTSYMDFSNQLEKIKLVLDKENYKYKLIEFVVNR